MHQTMRRARQAYRLAIVAVFISVALIGLYAIRLFGCFAGEKSALRLIGWYQLTWSRLLCLAIGVRIVFAGRPSRKAKFWVSNHVSWLDILVLGALRRVNFLSKAEVADWPVIGLISRLNGTLFIRRGALNETQQAVEKMMWRVRQGRRVAIFPEGTTTRGERVLHFYPRLFQAALLTGAELQPIAIRYEGEAQELAPFVDDDSFLPHLFRLLGARRIEATVRFCAPIHPYGMTRSDIARLAHRRVCDALGLVEAQASADRR